MAVSENYHQTHLDGTMEGWYQGSTHGTAAKGAHWITFIVLVCCVAFLFRDSWKAKGPSGKERFFAGYHEEYNISLYVNLFAMICYFGKITADTMDHNYSNVGPLIIGLGNYRYADYMLTCPLLAYDLLSQVRAPYKITGAILIFSVLLTGAATNFYPGEEMRAGGYAWFAFGCALYIWAYWLFFVIVKAQYERLLAMAYETEAKKAFLPLRLAVYTFFTIWIVFPVIWVLGKQGLGLISDEVSEVLHCVCDLVAKSFYGFALARYRGYFDKKMFALLEELGYDGEEELAHLEQDLKAMELTPSKSHHGAKDADMTSTLGYIAPPVLMYIPPLVGRRSSIERHKIGDYDTHRHDKRPSGEWSPVLRASKGYPHHDGHHHHHHHDGHPLGHHHHHHHEDHHHLSMGSPLRFSAVAGNHHGSAHSLLRSLNSPHKEAPRSPQNHPLLPAGVTVGQLKAQLELLNMQIQAVESESHTNVDLKDDLRRPKISYSSRSPNKLQSRSRGLDPNMNLADTSSESGAEVSDKHCHPALTPRSQRSEGRRRNGRDADDCEEGRGLC